MGYIWKSKIRGWQEKRINVYIFSILMAIDGGEGAGLQ